MDFGWIKDLAEQANKQEESHLEEDRKLKAEQKQLALATPPFVEKLCLLITSYIDEFNKYVQYDHLKAVTSKVSKKLKQAVKSDDPKLAYNEETSSFSICRKEWIYAVRGCAGVVEFIEMPTTAGSDAINIDDIGVDPTCQLNASIDKSSGQIVWLCKGKIMHGQDIIALCQDHVRQFVERTN